MPKRNVLLKEEKGITGLETAIILIAFVIVASVLSYVVISAGLFSSQKAKTAINSGLAQAGATVELKGNVIATMDETATPPCVTQVSFTVGIVPGGSAIDFTSNFDPLNPPADYNNPPSPTNRLIISYQDIHQQVSNLYFTVKYINYNNADNMLDPSELAIVTAYLEKNKYPTDMVNDIIAGSTFTISITPPDGAVLPIERTLPSRVSGLVNLY
jgi:archaeal flagellin FlaB